MDVDANANKGHDRRATALTVRVIPCLDVKDGRVVKGTHFKDLRDAGDPVELESVIHGLFTDFAVIEQ